MQRGVPRHRLKPKRNHMAACHVLPSCDEVPDGAWMTCRQMSWQSQKGPGGRSVSWSGRAEHARDKLGFLLWQDSGPPGPHLIDSAEQTSTGGLCPHCTILRLGMHSSYVPLVTAGSCT